MQIQKYFDKNNLHHAYLIEGDLKEVLPEILQFLKNLKIKVEANPDVYRISLDTFKIEDSRNLKSLSLEKNIGLNKRIFIISANHILLEAQTSMLKMFEEPMTDSIFFLVVPDSKFLLKTLVSRFYFIPGNEKELSKNNNVEKFIKMPKGDRINFIKEMFSTLEEANEEESSRSQNSPRMLATKFLDDLECFIVSKKKLDKTSVKFFNHLFKVRKYMHQNGTSVKNLMESVALIIPNL